METSGRGSCYPKTYNPNPSDTFLSLPRPSFCLSFMPRLRPRSLLYGHLPQFPFWQFGVPACRSAGRFEGREL